MRMSPRRAFFEGLVVVGDCSSSCARQFCGSMRTSVVVVPISSTSARAVVFTCDGEEGLSSDEQDDDAEESSETWSPSSHRSDNGTFDVPVRGFLESKSIGLLTAEPLLWKSKIRMRREPRWSRDDVQ